MAEIEQFLKKDSLRFGWITDRIREVSPGPERDKMMGEFWTWVWKYGYYKDEHPLIRGPCREVCKFIALYDEELSDVTGFREYKYEAEQYQKDWGSCHFVPSRGWVHSSFVPDELGQCRRALCSSHVVDGGGVALQHISLDMDRSNPVQSERFRAEMDRHNVDTMPEDSS
jgi:hypothetical protein